MHAWLVRSGRAGEREQWALTEGFTGGGFADVDDLTNTQDRAAVLEAVTRGIDGVPDGRAKNFAAQLWALRGRMDIGDIVVMPSKLSAHLSIGRIKSDYDYATAEPDRAKRHRRKVDWVATDVPRTMANQDLLYSLGAFSTICEISRNDAAWRLGEIMAGKPDPGARASRKPVKTIEAGDEASDVAQSDVEIETYALDRISSKVYEGFAGHRMADLVAAILEANGYDCDVSPPGADQGVDIIAGTGLLGLNSPKVVVQVKSEAGTVSQQVVQQLHGAIATHAADHGLLVAWGGITREARRYLSTQRFGIRVWDSTDVLAKLFACYDRLPAAVQRDIPLKRVWTIAEETGGD
jgi:restriction system protein